MNEFQFNNIEIKSDQRKYEIPKNIKFLRLFIKILFLLGLLIIIKLPPFYRFYRKKKYLSHMKNLIHMMQKEKIFIQLMDI